MLGDTYCCYLRKSRADRDAELRGDEETLARHKRILTELSEKMHKPISKFYSEVVSGDTIQDRPVMQELLSDVESGMWAGVFVVEIERLARGNTRDQGIVADTFKYSDTVIITPMKTYDPNNEFDEEYFEFGLFMSRREYQTIKRRLQRGRIASVKEGNFLGGSAPYGYRRIKLAKGYSLEVIPEQAKIVRQIFEWYCHGEQQPDGSIRRLGADAIAAKLDSLGIKPVVKDKWSKATIMDMLKNLTYTGKVFFGQYKECKTSVNGKIVTKRVYDPNHIVAQGKHEAIIPDELFHLAATVRKERKGHTIPVSYSLQNPLSGLVFCKKCGAMMTRLAPNRRNAYSTLKCPNRYCNNISSPLFLVEKQILQFLEDWLKSYSANDKVINFSPANNEINLKMDITKKLESDIAQFKLQLNRAYDLLEQNVYSIEVFRERQENLKASITAAEIQLQSTKKDVDHLHEVQNMRDRFIPGVRHLLDTYHTNSIELNNELLKELIDHIIYEKNERNTKGKLDNCNFTLNIYPRTSL